MPRRGEELLRRSLLDYRALRNETHAVGEFLGEARLMRNHQHGESGSRPGLRITFGTSPQSSESSADSKDARKPFDAALRIGPKVSAAALQRGAIARAMPQVEILGFLRG